MFCKISWLSIFTILSEIQQDIKKNQQKKIAIQNMSSYYWVQSISEFNWKNMGFCLTKLLLSNGYRHFLHSKKPKMWLLKTYKLISFLNITINHTMSLNHKSFDSFHIISVTNAAILYCDQWYNTLKIFPKKKRMYEVI